MIRPLTDQSARRRTSADKRTTSEGQRELPLGASSANAPSSPGKRDGSVVPGVGAMSSSSTSLPNNRNREARGLRCQVSRAELPMGGDVVRA